MPDREELFTIDELAQDFDVTKRTIQNYFKRYENELKDEIVKVGRTRYVTKKGKDFLATKAPKQPIEIIDNDNESKNEIMRLNAIIETQKSEIETLNNLLLNFQNNAKQEQLKIEEKSQDELNQYKHLFLNLYRKKKK